MMHVVDQVRLATGLAHAVPGAVLELSCVNGDPLIVAQRRLDAQLTLCQLRAALLLPAQPGVPRFADVICDVSIDAGLQHIGGGVYRRRSECGAEERWYATFLTFEHVNGVFDGCTIDVPPESMNARFMPDPELGVTVVRLVSNDAAHAHRLDEVALWAVAASMVEELVLDCRRTEHERRDG